MSQSQGNPVGLVEQNRALGERNCCRVQRVALLLMELDQHEHVIGGLEAAMRAVTMLYGAGAAATARQYFCESGAGH
ncbi:hypothetical protein [Polycyclovorans algicola]|uniref:hypothetical protein n=1 Tax=Polycyclovorans algicola TaxID=616992 RepID=UPI0004A738AF|nr:hypothetical protein [Polycyclovorans algicola]